MKMNFERLLKRSQLAIPLIAALLLPMRSGASPVENELDVTGILGTIALNYGDHLSGAAITPGVDVDVYSFFGTAGDTVKIAAIGSSALDPRLELKDPFNNPLQTQVCSNAFDCPVQIIQELAVTGQYFFNVSDSGGNNSGNYSLHIEDYPPKFNWQGIAYDQPFNESLGHRADHDYYAFHGEAGTEVRVNATGFNALDPTLRIWSPSGDLLDSQTCTNAFTCPVSSDLMLTESGIYQVGLYDSGFNNTGGYELGLSCLFGNCPTSTPPPVPTPVPAAIWFLLTGVLFVGRSVRIRR